MTELRWESAIQGFEALDRAHPVPPGGLLFTGSSSIGYWDGLEATYADLGGFRRGFGGSTFPELLYYTERIVLKYAPRAIVIYSGENDLGGGDAPEAIRDNLRRVVEKIRAALPAVRLYLISIKPSPCRAELFDRLWQANALLKALADGTPGMTYVDVASAMLTPAGAPRRELFRDDLLHMNAAGYALWNAILRPLLLADEG